MTRTVSALTAAYQPVPEFLKAAYESVATQELPDGWAWEWVVQEDGQTGDVAAMLPNDQRISPGDGRCGGECVTRTMAKWSVVEVRLSPMEMSRFGDSRPDPVQHLSTATSQALAAP